MENRFLSMFYPPFSIFFLLAAMTLYYLFRLSQKEKKIRELTLQLKTLETKLAENSRISLVAHLSAGIIHQISQPITAINGFIKFLKKEMNPQDTFYHPVCLVDEQCVYLKQMLNDMMELVRCSEMKCEQLNVHDVIYKAVNLLKDELRIRRINWDLDLLEGIPKVYADHIRLQQVFMNIAINAMQALTELPKDQEKYIRISSGLDAERKEVVISFQDTGPGIPQDEVDHIFEPFYSTKTKGAGIGLSLCQMLVQEQNGRITLANNSPQGARFQVHLPAVGENNIL